MLCFPCVSDQQLYYFVHVTTITACFIQCFLCFSISVVMLLLPLLILFSKSVRTHWNRWGQLKQKQINQTIHALLLIDVICANAGQGSSRDRVQHFTVPMPLSSHSRSTDKLIFITLFWGITQSFTCGLTSIHGEVEKRCSMLKMKTGLTFSSCRRHLALHILWQIKTKQHICFADERTPSSDRYRWHEEHLDCQTWSKVERQR